MNKIRGHAMTSEADAMTLIKEKDTALLHATPSARKR